MPTVQGRHVGQVQPLRYSDDGGVDRAERQVGVSADQLGPSARGRYRRWRPARTRPRRRTPRTRPRRPGVPQAASTPRPGPWSVPGACLGGSPGTRRSGRGAYRSGRSRRRAGRCRRPWSRRALQPLADDLIVPLGQVTAAGLPDADDRGPACLPAARLGDGRELGVGCDEQPQPGRLVRGEPVHQVVQVVMVMRRCDGHQSTASRLDQGAKSCRTASASRARRAPAGRRQQ